LGEFAGRVAGGCSSLQERGPIDDSSMEGTGDGQAKHENRWGRQPQKDRLTLVPSTHANLLVSKCAAGDPRAWQRLADQYRPVLEAAARRYVGPEDAEDVASNVIADLPKIASRWRGTSPFDIYILRVVRNTAIDMTRRRRSSPIEEAGDVRATEPGTHERAVMREQLARFYALLDGMGPEKRTAVELVTIHGVKGRTVAEMLAVSEATVSRWNTRAQQALATEWESE